VKVFRYARALGEGVSHGLQCVVLGAWPGGPERRLEGLAGGVVHSEGKLMAAGVQPTQYLRGQSCALVESGGTPPRRRPRGRRNLGRRIAARVTDAQVNAVRGGLGDHPAQLTGLVEFEGPSQQ
jgi:hypothetical protein